MMPRYYMHVCNGTGFIEDQEGIVLPDASVARDKAIDAAREVMAKDLRGGELDLSSFVEVEDEKKQLLFTIQFIDAVKLISKHTGEAQTRNQTGQSKPQS